MCMFQFDRSKLEAVLANYLNMKKTHQLTVSALDSLVMSDPQSCLLNVRVGSRVEPARVIISIEIESSTLIPGLGITGINTFLDSIGRCLTVTSRGKTTYNLCVGIVTHCKHKAKSKWLF